MKKVQKNTFIEGEKHFRMIIYQRIGYTWGLESKKYCFFVEQVFLLMWSSGVFLNALETLGNIITKKNGTKCNCESIFINV